MSDRVRCYRETLGESRHQNSSLLSQDRGLFYVCTTMKIKLSPQDECLRELDWYVTSDGYARRNFNLEGLHQRELLHRVIAGASKGDLVDHVNGDKLDNRRENLRICNHSQNMQNRKMHKNNTCGIKGIYFYRNKYRAQIRAAGKKHFLGSFDTPEEAKLAYERAAILLHAEFHRVCS